MESTDYAPIMAEFATLDAARAYKTRHGGWIFAPENDRLPLWFDASRYTASMVLTHPAARGMSGRLL